MTDHLPTHPRALREVAAIEARRALLDREEMRPLQALVRDLRAEERGEVPNFDPLDGGVQARVLFLMEKPGPMTDGSVAARRKGSGFISRDNDDPTAEAVFRFMETAGLDRRLTLIWNMVPWWNGTRTIKPEELAVGGNRLVRLLELLPELEVVVAVGAKAERARGLIEARALPFLSSPHPSPINRAARPDLWSGIPARWANALKFLKPPVGE